MTTFTRASNTVLDPSTPNGDSELEGIQKNSNALDNVLEDLNAAAFGVGDMLAANNLSDLASNATALSNLGGTSVGLDVFKASNANAARTAIGAGTGSGDGDMLNSDNLSGLASAATARFNLGVAIGSDVQAYNARLLRTIKLSSTINNGGM